MTEKDILASVKIYLENHQFQIERLIPSRLVSETKTPDFKVFSNGVFSFYCEVKSLSLLVNNNTKMFHWTTSITKLRDLIHKAIEQFSDQDPQHKFPWVLIFTSNNIQLNWSNMTHAVAGKVFFGDATVVDLTHLRRVKETNEDVGKIDFFVWLQMNKAAKIIQKKFLIHPKKTKYFEQVKEIGKKLESSPL